jgi:hypothetical protein
MESRVACSTSAWLISTPLVCALALILSPTARSISAQFPSSAETSSPFTGTGQFGFFHEAPRAFLSTSGFSSLSAPKKERHSESTELGSFSYWAWSSSI